MGTIRQSKKNVDKFNARARQKAAYYRKNKSKWKDWKRRNPQKVKRSMRRWYADENNRAHALRYHSNRRKTCPKYVKQQTSAVARIRQRRFAVKIRLLQYVGNGRCAVCGFDNPLALDFDHINPRTRVFTITRHLNKPWEELVKEARKCQILCANHHRIKTAEKNDYQNGRYRATFLRSSSAIPRPLQSSEGQC